MEGAAAAGGAVEPCSRSLAGVGGRREGVSLWKEAVVDISRRLANVLDWK